MMLFLFVDIWPNVVSSAGGRRTPVLLQQGLPTSSNSITFHRRQELAAIAIFTCVCKYAF